jgi:hypothetical protein
MKHVEQAAYCFLVLMAVVLLLALTGHITEWMLLLFLIGPVLLLYALLGAIADYSRWRHSQEQNIRMQETASARAPITKTHDILGLLVTGGIAVASILFLNGGGFRTCFSEGPRDYANQWLCKWEIPLFFIAIASGVACVYFLMQLSRRKGL